jgi:malate synthase
VQASSFWASFESIVHDMAPENKLLVGERNSLQSKIDAWHLANKSNPVSSALIAPVPDATLS